MSLISYNGLVDLIRDGVINAPIANVSGASIDITLHDELMMETDFDLKNNNAPIDLAAKENIKIRKFKMDPKGEILMPGSCILASSAETFNLPNNVAAEYKLKSSLARNFLNHMLAGWCDPGWNNSKLTLELQNCSRYHNLLLRPGMKIGQMVFWECEPVPERHSYATKGQYNNQYSVTASKGVR